MDLRQLAALVAVADEGTFSAAADALHTVQSNVSAHVARLEAELGVTLVDRAAGRLTEEGRVVVDRARRVQVELDAMVSDVAAVRHEVSGTVRLGMIGSTGRWLVPRLFEAVEERHPAVRIRVLDASTTSLLPQLMTGRFDLAVLNLPLEDPDVTVEPLFSEALVVVAPTGHPLADGAGEDDRARDGAVSLAELARHPLLLPPPGTGFRDELDLDASDAGVVLRTRAEVDGVRMIASMAFEGFAPAVIPATAVPDWVEGEFRVLTLVGTTPRSVGLVRRRRGLPSAAARAVREVLHDVVAEQGPRRPGVTVALG